MCKKITNLLVALRLPCSYSTVSRDKNNALQVSRAYKLRSYSIWLDTTRHA